LASANGQGVLFYPGVLTPNKDFVFAMGRADFLHFPDFLRFPLLPRNIAQ
jgi:hypothetical protein